MARIEQSVDVEDIDEGGESDVVGDGEVEISPEEGTTPKPEKVVDSPALEGGKSDSMVCVIDGTYVIEGNTVIITSLPLRTFKEFSLILSKLIDKKIVTDFRNRSKGEDIRFEVEMVVDEAGKLPAGNLMKIFRLRKISTMSNLVLLDEHGLPRRFKDAEDILQYFHAMRLEYYDRRKNAIVESLKQKLFNLESKMSLIRLLTSKGSDRIQYEERDEEEILAEITVKLPQVPHEVYRELNVRQLNQTQLDKLSAQIKAAQDELAALVATTKEVIWKKDILAFLKEYRAIYGGSSIVSEAYKALPW